MKGRKHLLAYKVVTNDMKSLGLRKNPNIMQFDLGKWIYLQPNETEKSKRDWGGIWAAIDLSNAKKLAKYMKSKHQISPRIFKVALDQILFFNSYRIKTNGVNFLEEILY